SPMARAQDPVPGIARELALARAAQIEDVAYVLRFRLDRNCKEVVGEALIAFELAAGRDRQAPVVFDFAGGELTRVRVNDSDPALRVVRDHWIRPARLLAAGHNPLRGPRRSLDAPAGTAAASLPRAVGRPRFLLPARRPRRRAPALPVLRPAGSARALPRRARPAARLAGGRERRRGVAAGDRRRP